MHRNSTFTLVTAALIVLCLPALAFAQYPGHPFELTFQGGATQPLAEDGTAMSYTLGTGIAFRTTDQLRVGAEFSYNGIGVGDDARDVLDRFGIDTSNSILEYGAFARFHLADPLAGPYLKGALGARQLRATVDVLGTSTSVAETVWGYGVGLGWLLPGTGDLATFFEAEYTHAFPVELGASNQVALDQVGFDMLKVGMGALFGTGF